MSCALIVHGTCNNDDQVSANGYGDTPAEALSNGQGKINIICATKGGTKTYGEVEEVDC